MTTTYRITVDGATHIWREYPGERWARIADICEERGAQATFERQDVFDFEGSEDAELFLAGLMDTAGYIRFGNRIACPWVTMAAFGNSSRALGGAR